MKILLISAIIIGLVFSCKKDDKKQDSTIPLTTEQKIRNNWSIENIIDCNYIGSSTMLDNKDTLYKSGSIDFGDGNKAYADFGGDLDTVDYLIVSDNSLDFDGERYEIIELTTSKFTFKYFHRSDTPYYDNIVTLKRQ